MSIFKKFPVAVWLGLAVFVSVATASELSVRLGQAPTRATIEVSGIGAGRVGVLMFSDDLANWFPVASSPESTLDFTERSVAGQRFFQLVETTPPTL
ncbi:uncharacterized protein METZ01_LOCUS161109, partial [marine metagenome]